jgi:biofilm PGA synthesis N-glycosyltransferase PgaC
MFWLQLCFWSAAVGVVYVYILYPLLLGLAAWLRPRPTRRDGPVPRSFSIVLCVRNEQEQIERRLEELVRLAAATGLMHEVMVVCDGCTDATAERAGRFASCGVRVVELPTNLGKAAALSAGCDRATGEVLVFADARQSWAETALPLLLENFADPGVGAASGNLIIDSQPGILAGVKLYWRYEKWIRRQESCLHSTVGVTGSISAVRRELFQPIPLGTVLDDVYWPLRVAMRGYRVVHDERAHAFDRLPDRAGDEFRRKLRTLAGNFQVATQLPAALLPWRNPLWLQFVSHKLLRLVVPWALLLLVIASAVLPGPVYAAAFWLQVVFYLIGSASILAGRRLRSRIAGAAAAFLVLNSAAWVAFWIWISGRTTRAWRPVAYEPPPQGRPSPPLREASEVLHP